MSYDVDHKKEKELKEILGDLHCPKGFRCYREGLENLCRARKMGIGYYLECLEDKPEFCKFSFSVGDVHFCECPLRLHIWKALQG